MAYGDENSRTLYVGSLDRAVTQEYIVALFGQIAPCKSCKMIVDNPAGSDPYCFVEFFDHKSAETAKTTMHNRVVFGKNIKVNWATTSMKKDGGKTYSLFVGDLTPEIDQHILRKTFEPYGRVVDARVVKDTNTGKPKGYGFVAFANEQDAENAKDKMNGQYLGAKAIRTNWATRKPASAQRENYDLQPGGYNASFRSTPKDYKQTFQMSSESNTTVYVGNLPDGYKDDDIRSIFEAHGQIVELRVYTDRNYAFVKYTTHEEATRAIVGCHGQQILDKFLKVNWGRESESHSNQGSSMNTETSQYMKNNASAQQQPQQTYQQQQQHQQAYQFFNTQFAHPLQQQQQQQQQYQSGPSMYGQQSMVGMPGGSTQQGMYSYYQPDSSSMGNMMMQGQMYNPQETQGYLGGGGSNPAGNSQHGFGFQT